MLLIRQYFRKRTVVIEFGLLAYPLQRSILNPFATTMRQVPVSANTAIHIVPMPASVRTKKISLIERAIPMFSTSSWNVFFESLMNSGSLRRSSSIRATSAVSIAVSVPAAPMANPISARARAGASLMPSPTIPMTRA